MRVDRLLRLADFLEKEVPDEKINMYRWTDSCGTVLCALGWATRVPEFREAGLRMNKENNDYGYPTGSYSEFRFPVFDDKECFSAAEAFFEIDTAWAEWIFSPISYSNPIYKETVIARIRNVASCGDMSCLTR